MGQLIFYYMDMEVMVNTISPSFSTTRLSLINRNIIWATAHIRGGMERGMKYWEEGKMLNKKNTFKDYISCN